LLLWLTILLIFYEIRRLCVSDRRSSWWWIQCIYDCVRRDDGARQTIPQKAFEGRP